MIDFFVPRVGQLFEYCSMDCCTCYMVTRILANGRIEMAVVEGTRRCTVSVSRSHFELYWLPNEDFRLLQEAPE